MIGEKYGNVGDDMSLRTSVLKTIDLYGFYLKSGKYKRNYKSAGNCIPVS